MIEEAGMNAADLVAIHPLNPIWAPRSPPRPRHSRRHLSHDQLHFDINRTSKWHRQVPRRVSRYYHLKLLAPPRRMPYQRSHRSHAQSSVRDVISPSP
jgi:hypothetical protein